MDSVVASRRATCEDAGPIAAIYNAGVAEGVATFRATSVDATAFERRIGAGELFLVAEEASEVVGACWVNDYDPVHQYYAGVGEVTLYVDPLSRRQGVGRVLLEAVAAEALSRGRHKLLAKIFSDNEPSLALFRACGYREVGTHHRHSQLHGEWKDVVVVERLLG